MITNADEIELNNLRIQTRHVRQLAKELYDMLNLKTKYDAERVYTACKMIEGLVIATL